MILRYCGQWVGIDRKKWKALPLQEKLKCVGSYFAGNVKYFSKSLKDYWIGYVNVSTRDILCRAYGEPSHHELYEISIFCGRHGSGQWFSRIDKSAAQQIVKDWEFSDKKRYQLHFDLGCGVSQEYTFTRHQKDMLMKQLKPLLDRKWYEGSREED